MSSEKQMDGNVDVPAVKYGNIGNGEYITPFNATVVYHDDSAFESAIATLVSRAQLIPLIDNLDYNAIADSCEFLTPEVLIFGEEFPLSAIAKFIERGFKFVHVFTRGDVSKNKYMVDGKYPLPMVVFDISTLYDHVVFIEGLLPTIICDYVVDGLYRKDQSTDGYYFCKYLYGRGLNNQNNPNKMILRMISSFRGYDEAQSMVIKGRHLVEHNDAMAHSRIMSAPVIVFANENALVLYGGELMDEISQLLPMNPRVVRDNVKFAVFYNLVEVERDPATTITQDKSAQTFDVKWKITVVGTGKNSTSAVEYLRGFAPKPTGDFNRAYAFRSAGSFPLGKTYPHDDFDQ